MRVSPRQETGPRSVRTGMVSGADHSQKLPGIVSRPYIISGRPFSFGEAHSIVVLTGLPSILQHHTTNQKLRFTDTAINVLTNIIYVQ